MVWRAPPSVWSAGLGSLFGQIASNERREEDWRLQRGLAERDVLIGGQQIVLANDHVAVATQEQRIAHIQMDHAGATVQFLAGKFTSAELYEFMSEVLDGIYRFFLQQATALAKLAENQLAFERQEPPQGVIQGDYYAAPDGGSDRRGITGSARLLADIVELDQHAFLTDRRKLQLTKTFSLARLAPIEFARFRETGVMVIGTPQALFDRDFPGHYLRLVKRVRTSVIALIPPTEGIRATLSTPGTSRVVIGGDTFRNVVVRRDPETVGLSSPRDATGLFELVPDSQPELLLPFEGTGVDTVWRLELPKAANPFDYSTIADVLLTLEYTALNSFDYRQQVIQTLDPELSADRPFSFRQQFPDQWYDLNNPDQTATPMTVRFKTARGDFLPNIDDLEDPALGALLCPSEWTTGRNTGCSAPVQKTGRPDSGRWFRRLDRWRHQHAQSQWQQLAADYGQQSSYRRVGTGAADRRHDQELFQKRGDRGHLVRHHLFWAHTGMACLVGVLRESLNLRHCRGRTRTRIRRELKGLSRSSACRHSKGRQFGNVARRDPTKLSGSGWGDW